VNFTPPGREFGIISGGNAILAYAERRARPLQTDGVPCIKREMEICGGGYGLKRAIDWYESAFSTTSGQDRTSDNNDDAGLQVVACKSAAKRAA
jgi:hypothetical protein